MTAPAAGRVRLAATAAFVTPIVAFVALLGLLEINYRFQLARLPAGIAAYLTPYEVSAPTMDIIDDVIGSRAQEFDDRDVLLVLGNSIAWGAGAVDRLHLARQLSGRFNVINAALPGGYLPASAAVGVLAADRVLDRNPGATFHIVAVYPVTRFYTTTTYAAFGESIARICEARPALVPYLWNCEQAREKFPPRDWRVDLKNQVVRGAPCQLNPTLALSWARYLTIYCESFVDREDNDPGFVAQARKTAGKYGDAGSVRSFFATTGDWVLQPDVRQGFIRELTNNSGRLVAFLRARGARFTMSVVVTSEAPGALADLAPEWLAEFSRGRRQFAEDLRQAHPDWTAIAVDPFDDDDYWDRSHMNESGQTKLAAIITGLVR